MVGDDGIGDGEVESEIFDVALEVLELVLGTVR